MTTVLIIDVYSQLPHSNLQSTESEFADNKELRTLFYLLDEVGCRYTFASDGNNFLKAKIPFHTSLITYLITQSFLSLLPPKTLSESKCNMKCAVLWSPDRGGVTAIWPARDIEEVSSFLHLPSATKLYRVNLTNIWLLVCLVGMLSRASLLSAQDYLPDSLRSTLCARVFVSRHFKWTYLSAASVLTARVRAGKHQIERTTTANNLLCKQHSNFESCWKSMLCTP